MHLWQSRRARRALFALASMVLVACVLAFSSYAQSQPVPKISGAVSDRGPDQRPFTMAKADLVVEWAIPGDQELACGGGRIAGGVTSGPAVFSHLGRSTISASGAWDLARLIPDPQYDPVGPAGGPVATILGPGEYPYTFHFDPATGQCGSGPTATGEVHITAANGDTIHGSIQGGEAHRLDFVVPGDGVESFTIVALSGGTGRFIHAAGSFVMHTIIRFDPAAGHFVVDLAEVLPGGTIGY